MTPEDFVKKWRKPALNEQQIAQSHFRDVCDLVGIEMPVRDGKTAAGDIFTFEYPVKTESGRGRADVYYEGRFAVEYKTPDKYKDLDAAFKQLKAYKDNLRNPPLLVVTDINRWEIHTNFNNADNRPYVFNHSDIAGKPEVLGWLRDMFHAPQRLHPGSHTENVTQEAADAFRLIADNMRRWDVRPTQIAYFVTKLVFCMFAEDARLLPTIADDNPDGIFTHIVKQSLNRPSIFTKYLQNLFAAMNDGGELMMRKIRYFNGTLFVYTHVEELLPEALEALIQAADLNWKAIEPSIFGTLFERSLDPSKRAQLGAHYTSREDIELIVKPVLMQPLIYEWETVQLEAANIRELYDKAQTGRVRNAAVTQLLELREGILSQIRETTVLDPACGSGNFLYVSLQLLMNLEKDVIEHKLWSGLQRAAPEVHPRQMYGIEKDPIAHALASIVVWIGYIQWRTNNAYIDTVRDPILEELKGNIVCKDAILPPSVPPMNQAEDAQPMPASMDVAPGRPSAPGEICRGDTCVALDSQGETVEWPTVDVIVGNPPFLGGSKMRGELGDDYYERLTEYYDGRLPGFADLVCYWFEKAREQIENGKAERAGLLATNSIRGGANREVLKRIKESGDIFMAWSDRPWILDGAAVRVSMIGFDPALQAEKTLDGTLVRIINSDLTGDVDITVAHQLMQNSNLCFEGTKKAGSFDISAEVADTFLKADLQNSRVVRPWVNGSDIVRKPRNMWIIDFNMMEYDVAKIYLLPMQYVEEHVKPVRLRNVEKFSREKWWLHQRARPEMRKAMSAAGISRFICTPRVAKHRIFVWFDLRVLPDSATNAIARDDDYFFGVLHSKLHETWSLRMGTWLGKGNDPRYTPTTTFETFPFPWSPGREDTSHPAYAAISAAAKQLHRERHAWLNPEDVSAKALKDRTLTNLYNALQVWRKRDSMKTKPAAREFAPRLDELHRALDEAVCDAYGWEYGVLDDEEEILRRLLALNLERAG
ncbi:MAG: class I SAM-dependent DNA methyltransferase [Chloroflexota bacterium]|nr:class I SAM-dependent DNA methyltransferase [Chloroflexota bacterium]MDE2910488.1 class I SAM-dependent DNA methyltransferase [Chloroflexota bacterium]